MNNYSAKEFLELLNIDASHTFHKLNISLMITSAHGFAQDIWDNPKLDTVTDHGISHSYRVLQRALDIAEKIIPEKHKLSRIERMILGVAGLIHDIGMQYNKYFSPGLSNNKVRKKHCKLGQMMIQNTLDRKRNGLPSFPFKEEYIEYVTYSRYVAFSHCSKNGKDFWDKLKEEHYSAERKAPGGDEDMRIRLLAGLMRLADELDMDQSRVPEINMLLSASINTESKAHWFCCYYTSEIRIEVGAGGFGGLRVYLKWWVPDCDEELELIRILLQEIRQKHFNEEKKIITPYLKWSEKVEPPVVDDLQMELEPERLDNIIPLPQEIKNYIREELRPYQLGKKKIKIYSNLMELSGNEFDMSKSKADRFIRAGEGVINEHFVLKTGWHTDKYIKCRELVTDKSFLDSLIKGSAKKFRSFKPTRIISIGTSAIRIGSLLSISLNTKFSYAIGDVKFFIDKYPSSEIYSEYENAVILSKNERLLIIDDILGVGTVLSKVTSKLRFLGFENKNIKVLYIYSLGYIKDIIKIIPDIEIYYLMRFPDIKYWKEDEQGECEVCKNKPQIRNYE